MFCKSCGRQIDNDSKFCSFCGTKQSKEFKPQVQADTTHSDSTDSQVKKEEPIYHKSPNIVQQLKFDPTYEKEVGAIIIGVGVLVLALIFTIVGPIKFEDRESYGQLQVVTSLVSLILRITVTVWVVNIAKQQNRETFGLSLIHI